MAVTQMIPSETGRNFETVCEVLDRHGRNPARLIPILQAVQEEYRYLPEEALNYIEPQIRGLDSFLGAEQVTSHINATMESNHPRWSGQPLSPARTDAPSASVTRFRNRTCSVS